MHSLIHVRFETAKRKGELDGDQLRRENAKASLERYTHYYERYDAHHKAQAKVRLDAGAAAGGEPVVLRWLCNGGAVLIVSLFSIVIASKDPFCTLEAWRFGCATVTANGCVVGCRPLKHLTATCVTSGQKQKLNILLPQAKIDAGKVSNEWLDHLADSTKTPTSQLKFINEAWAQIVECRRILKYTYAFGYYSWEDPDNKDEQTQRNFFEYQQVRCMCVRGFVCV